MPTPERRALCLFAAVTEVIAQLTTLTGPVVLDVRHVAEALNVAMRDETQVLQAIEEARRSAVAVQR